MLVFDGAEVPSNRLLLESCGVKAMGVSFWRLRKRGLPKTKQYLFSEKLPEDVQVYLDSGSLQAKEAGLSESELLDYAAEYQDFVVHNADRLSGATEFSSDVLGPRWVSEQRSAFWMEIPEIFWPVWHSDMGHHQLHALAEQYENVAIHHSSIEADTSLSGRVNAFVSQFQTGFHALALAKPDNLRSIRFDTASTLSWMSPMLRGETIVWDGMRLVRYPKRMKEQARSRYRGVVTSAGLDFDKIMADDPQEVTKLAIWSYLQLDKKLRPNHLRAVDDALLVDNSGFQQEGTFVETPPEDVDNKDQGVRKLEVVRAPSNEVSEAPNKATPREPHERADLPVFSVTHKQVVDYDDNGKPLITTVPVLESGNKSLRNCDTCFVASNCPAFKKGSECAFGLPVEVKTKDQLKALLNAIIEMQGQRVAFARFSEELNGGYPDPNLSQEIDRLFKLVKGLKDLEDNREFIKMTVERRGAGGVLSALFGDRAQSLNELPNGGYDANQTNRIIDGSLDS